MLKPAHVTCSFSIMCGILLFSKMPLSSSQPEPGRLSTSGGSLCARRRRRSPPPAPRPSPDASRCPLSACSVTPAFSQEHWGGDCHMIASCPSRFPEHGSADRLPGVSRTHASAWVPHCLPGRPRVPHRPPARGSPAWPPAPPRSVPGLRRPLLHVLRPRGAGEVPRFRCLRPALVLRPAGLGFSLPLAALSKSRLVTPTFPPVPPQPRHPQASRPALRVSPPRPPASLAAAQRRALRVSRGLGRHRQTRFLSRAPRVHAFAWAATATGVTRACRRTSLGEMTRPR